VPNDYPYFPFYVDDFSADENVEAMNTLEVGSYILLLCKAWKQEPRGTLPADDAVLARWARLIPSDWSAAKPRVLAAFRLGSDGRWHQKRMELEARKLRERNIKRSKAGKEGAAARWQTHAIANADAMRSQCDSMPRASDSLFGSDSLDSSSPSEEKKGKKGRRERRKGGGAGGGKPRERDLLFDAVAEVTGLDPSIRSNGSLIAGVCSQLRESDADPAYGPEDVRKLAEVWPTCAGWTADTPLTPPCVAKYIAWSRNPPKQPHLNGKAPETLAEKIQRLKPKESQRDG
jgi:uncharacterized protein YdaU (DUF1376 family)